MVIFREVVNKHKSSYGKLYYRCAEHETKIHVLNKLYDKMLKNLETYYMYSYVLWYFFLFKCQQRSVSELSILLIRVSLCRSVVFLLLCSCWNKYCERGSNHSMSFCFPKPETWLFTHNTPCPTNRSTSYIWHSYTLTELKLSFH
jgi:hypothetical protein